MTTRRLGRRVLRFGAIDSTMDEAARLADSGEPEGTIVVADEQTAGRGRAGRTWTAPPGNALLCSVLLRPAVPPDRLPVLSLLVGVAAAEAIEEATGLWCRLKWPNDLWLGDDDPGRKVGGVLLTSRLNRTGVEHAIAGIGVNLTSEPAALPAGATSVAAELARRERASAGRWVDTVPRGRPVPGAEPHEVPPGRSTAQRTVVEHATGLQSAVLRHLTDRLNDVYDEYLVTGGHPGLDAWRRRAALVGQEVAVIDGDERHVGRYTGIDDDGRLLLEDQAGTIRRIVAGDLTRGPRSLRR